MAFSQPKSPDSEILERLAYGILANPATEEQSCIGISMAGPGAHIARTSLAQQLVVENPMIRYVTELRP